MFRIDLHVEVKCASPPDLITHFAGNGVTVEDVQPIDSLTFSCRIAQKDYEAFSEVLKKYGAECIVRKKTGMRLRIKQLKKRPVLIFGVLLLVICVLFLPGRILFVRVTGNVKVPSNLIVEKAAQNGVYFGAARAQIRSEKIKNLLLSEIPELQWAGINTYGCVAVISVQELIENRNEREDYVANNLIASDDGIVTDISVTRGSTLCKVGQAVKKGQVLVSGMSDYGICLKETGAEGEIYANTGHRLRVLTPRTVEKKTATVKTETRYGIILGKKLINFYKGSGISGTNCDRMYSQCYIVLPGGFQLPLSFVKEEIVYYDTEEASVPDSEMVWLNTASENYLLSRMVAGEIRKKNVAIKFEDDLCELYGAYQCREIISRYQNKGA